MKAVSLSEARSELIRQRVLTAAAAVLAEGGPLTFAAVAGAAGVPERTLYRHYPTREALLGALFHWANERLLVDAERPVDAEGFASLVRQTFPGFDAMAPVIRELLATPEGRIARLAANAARQRSMLALVEHEAAGLDRTQARRVAAVVQLLSAAAAWQTFRDYWGMNGAEAAETSVLACQLILEGARARRLMARRAPKSRRKALRRTPEAQS
jgi:AcrR family transcriptional regulator